MAMRSTGLTMVEEEDSCPTGVCPIHKKAWTASLAIIVPLAVLVLGAVGYLAYVTVMSGAGN